ncbi:MAG: DUF3822 family protein [Bacteroides sp.]|nr:DUF3822 family protein [Bacteroides sp.]
MNILTAADYADTGQWRLIVKISASGMCAHIENTIHTDLEPQLLFATEWEPDSDNLLRNIENAVYDHPRVLEDYSARIIVYDPKTLFMPTEAMEDIEGAEENVYTSVYKADPSDVMVDIEGDLMAAHCLVTGIKGFLNRTFPGAKLESNLMSKVRTLRQTNDGVKLYLEAREREADFVLLDGRNLLSASTHPFACAADIVYHALNIIDVYELNVKTTPVMLSGEGVTEELKELFKAVNAAQL